MRRKGVKSAFTFIELFLVVIIIAVLLGISLPRFRGSFNNFQLNSFAAGLQDELNYWHQRSIVAKRPVSLKIDAEKNEYWVQFTDSEDRLKTYQIPSGINMQADSQEITFYPDASISEVTINLINSSGEELRLTTQGVFGGIKVLREE